MMAIPLVRIALFLGLSQAMPAPPAARLFPRGGATNVTRTDASHTAARSAAFEAWANAERTAQLSAEERSLALAAVSSDGDGLKLSPKQMISQCVRCGVSTAQS